VIEVQSRTSCEDLIKEKDKEIEFHKNNERIAIDCQNKLSEEIERLNNIINEIKELCNENTNGIDDDGYDDAYYDRVYVREIDEIIEKYELKDSDK
jgi:pantothenate kinase